MHERRDRYPLQAAVERLRAVSAKLVMVARHRRLVDLDESQPAACMSSSSAFKAAATSNASSASSP